jgi:hypothetical protein
VPAEIADLKQDQVGRMQTIAKEPGREKVEAIVIPLWSIVSKRSIFPTLT